MALKIITVSSSIVTICIIPLAPLVANSVFNKPDISNYFQMISFGILPLALIYLHSESLRALKKIKEFVFMRNVAAFLIAVVILLFLFFFNKTDYDPFIAYVSGIALTSYLSYRVWSKISGYKLTSIRSTVKLKSILEVSIPMLTVSSLVFLMSWIDTIMIGIFKTERDVGIYNVAVKITDFMSIFLISIGSIVAPKFAEAYGINDMGMSRKLLRLSSRMLFYLAIPIFTLIFTASYYILMFFGKDFIQGNLALRILLVGQVVNILSGLNGIFLNMNGEHRFVRNVIIIAAVLNIVLNYLLIPRFGLIGAASATTVIRIFWNMLFIIYIYYKYNALSFYLPFLPGNRKMDVL